VSTLVAVAVQISAAPGWVFPCAARVQVSPPPVTVTDCVPAAVPAAGPADTSATSSSFGELVLNVAVLTVPVPVLTSALTFTSVVTVPGVGGAVLGVDALVRSPTALNAYVVAGPLVGVSTCSCPALSYVSVDPLVRPVRLPDLSYV